jgi:hypothetical protein
LIQVYFQTLGGATVKVDDLKPGQPLVLGRRMGQEAVQDPYLAEAQCEVRVLRAPDNDVLVVRDLGSSHGTAVILPEPAALDADIIEWNVQQLEAGLQSGRAAMVEATMDPKGRIGSVTVETQAIVYPPAMPSHPLPAGWRRVRFQANPSGPGTRLWFSMVLWAKFAGLDAREEELRSWKQHPNLQAAVDRVNGEPVPAPTVFRDYSAPGSDLPSELAFLSAVRIIALAQDLRGDRDAEALQTAFREHPDIISTVLEQLLNDPTPLKQRLAAVYPENPWSTLYPESLAAVALSRIRILAEDAIPAKPSLQKAVAARFRDLVEAVLVRSARNKLLSPTIFTTSLISVLKAERRHKRLTAETQKRIQTLLILAAPIMKPAPGRALINELGHWQADPDVKSALESMSRHAPEPQMQAAAARALMNPLLGPGTSIDAMDLNYHVIKTLHHHGIHTAPRLAQLSESDLRALHPGPRSLTEVRRALAVEGLALSSRSIRQTCEISRLPLQMGDLNVLLTEHVETVDQLRKWLQQGDPALTERLALHTKMMGRPTRRAAATMLHRLHRSLNEGPADAAPAPKTVVVDEGPVYPEPEPLTRDVERQMVEQLVRGVAQHVARVEHEIGLREPAMAAVVAAALRESMEQAIWFDAFPRIVVTLHLRPTGRPLWPCLDAQWRPVLENLAINALRHTAGYSQPTLRIDIGSVLSGPDTWQDFIAVSGLPEGLQVTGTPPTPLKGPPVVNGPGYDLADVETVVHAVEGLFLREAGRFTIRFLSTPPEGAKTRRRSIDDIPDVDPDQYKDVSDRNLQGTVENPAALRASA